MIDTTEILVLLSCNAVFLLLGAWLGARVVGSHRFREGMAVGAAMERERDKPKPAKHNRNYLRKV